MSCVVIWRVCFWVTAIRSHLIRDSQQTQVTHLAATSQLTCWKKIALTQITTVQCPRIALAAVYVSSHDWPRGWLACHAWHRPTWGDQGITDIIGAWGVYFSGGAKCFSRENKQPHGEGVITVSTQIQSYYTGCIEIFTLYAYLHFQYIFSKLIMDKFSGLMSSMIISLSVLVEE